MNVSFEYYKVFYHVARLGSITLAAKALFLSQPAVSKCIRQLEKVLGCALFYRMHKGMRLTPEGEVLYQYVAQACEQIAIGEKKNSGHAASGLGKHPYRFLRYDHACLPAPVSGAVP